MVLALCMHFQTNFHFILIYVHVFVLQILKPADKKKFPYGGLNAGRPVTPPRGQAKGKGKM